MGEPGLEVCSLSGTCGWWGTRGSRPSRPCWIQLLPCCCSLPCQSLILAHSVPPGTSLKISFARELTEKGMEMFGKQCHQNAVPPC